MSEVRRPSVTFLGEDQPKLRRKAKQAYSDLLLAAKDARAFPPQSGFFVRAAGVTESGLVVTGGNIEYQLSDAFVHGETSVIAGAFSRAGKDDKLTAIGFYNREFSENPPAPCGKCRDAIKEYCDPKLVLLAGTEKRMTATPFKEYLFDSFKSVDPEDLSPQGYDEARVALGQSLDAYLPERMRSRLYGAALVGESRGIFRGSFYTNAGYDASPPILNAVQVWRNTAGDLDFSKVVLGAYDRLPKPSYRDRQALLELDESLMLATGREKPLEVELVSFDRQTGDVTGAAVTNSREWLPHPFSPAAFGMTRALERQIEVLG